MEKPFSCVVNLCNDIDYRVVDILWAVGTGVSPGISPFCERSKITYLPSASLSLISVGAMDAGSEGYYTYYYVSFTQQERKQLKELFGRDLFAKGYTDHSACQKFIVRRT